ncbi:OLC1v1027769C1 [Oldenlandia corymbosa var. corymbosa]|uniref:OLC1v1027769C1 n=1 Tax=Oldenlandia corymbosa var. corymbosa TaxID=529605 RepID=A0AAV1CC24_OLDCO|nr:OLC1v1027769C1 [Oldenlandia corymbosa var. corymbosa]
MKRHLDFVPCKHVISVMCLRVTTSNLLVHSYVCETPFALFSDIRLITLKDGRVSQLEHVFIRGSKVRFMVIPDMLKNAPMFKRLEAKIKGKGSAVGVGRGRAVAMRARAQAAGRGAAPGRGAVPPVRR